MKDMTQREPDSAMPTGEPASAVRSPDSNPRGTKSLCDRMDTGSKGLPSRTEENGERTQLTGWRRLGGWGQNGWKCGRDKQGDPSGDRPVFMAKSPKSRPTGVRASVVANLYLNPLDHEVARRVWEMVRYADDFVVLCRTREEADAVLRFLQQWTVEAGLTLHPTKTRIVNAQVEGFDFLGWHFRGSKKWPRKKSLQKLQDKLRPLTKRANGRSLSDIVARANPILRRLARILPWKSSQRSARTGWMAAATPAGDAAKAGETARLRAE
jgi:hypothetical protein